MKFCKMIKLIRKSNGITMKEAAIKMGATTHGAYSQYEYGLKTPSKEQKRKILKALQ